MDALDAALDDVSAGGQPLVAGFGFDIALVVWELQPGLSSLECLLDVAVGHK